MADKNEHYYDHYWKDSAMHRHLSSESIKRAEKEED